MPLYEYRCEECNTVSEEYRPFNQYSENIPCKRCGKMAIKILSAANIQNDHPSWLDDSVRNQITDEFDPPIENRTQLNRVLKEKGIVENPKSNSR